MDELIELTDEELNLVAGAKGGGTYHPCPSIYNE